MKNYKDKIRKNQVFSKENLQDQNRKFQNIEVFKKLLEFLSLQGLRNSKREHVLSFLKESFGDKIIFVPQSFSWDEKKKKVNKKPLLKRSWKNEITFEDVKYWLSRIAYSYSKGIFNAGIALRAEDFSLFIIDIDDLDKFSSFLNISEFLKNVEKDAYLITKSISGRGYHIYINQKLFQAPEVKNQDLLKNFGFEIKKQGLITFFPSAYQHGKTLFTCDVLYINPENLDKTEISSESLKKLCSLVKNFYEQKQKEQEKILRIKEEIRKKKKALEKERKDFSDLKEIINKVKKEVSFYDLIPEKFVKHCSHYDLYHCPFHQPDRSPSFAVYHDGEHEFGYDFHDNTGYDIIAFYQEYYRTDFITALKDLCEKAGIKFPERKKKEKKDLLKEIRKRILNNEPFETEKAFYTAPFAFTKGSKKRYAFLKSTNELWEVLEKRELIDSGQLNNFSEKVESVFMRKVNIFDRQSGEEVEKCEFVSFYYSKLIASFRIVEGVKYIDPLGALPRFDFVIISKGISEGKKQKIENIAFEEFVLKMKNEGLIISNQRIKDALSKCLDDFIKEGKIVEKVEIPKAGVFFFDGSLKLSRINPKEVSKEKLREALLFLNELISVHYEHIKEKAAVILKWFITAPFTFAVKQRKSTLKGLYLFGPSATGKSTITLLFSNLYRNHTRCEEKAGSSIDTIARLGNTFSEDTFPKIISEPQGALTKDEIMEAIKNAMTNTIARGKYSYGQYIEIPALANVVFTSNHFIPSDDAFIRRFFVISFSISERPDKDKIKNFAAVKAQTEHFLPLIGDYLLKSITKESDIFLKLNEDTQFKAAEEILKKMYEEAELKPPEWISCECENDFTLIDFENEIRKQIVSEIRDYVLEQLRKAGKSIDLLQDENNVKEIARLLSFCVVRKNDVLITQSILFHIRQKITTLKVLAEILGYEFRSKVDIREAGKKTSICAIVLSYKEFYQLVSIYADEDYKEADGNSNINDVNLGTFQPEAIDIDKLPF